MKKRCPKCNSENITVNGVKQNQKKGLFARLSPQAIYDASFRAGQKMFNNHTSNAECLSCGNKWVV